MVCSILWGLDWRDEVVYCSVADFYWFPWYAYTASFAARPVRSFTTEEMS